MSAVLWQFMLILQCQNLAADFLPTLLPTLLAKTRALDRMGFLCFGAQPCLGLYHTSALLLALVVAASARPSADPLSPHGDELRH